MRRIFIQLDSLDIYDEFHYETPDGFGVDEERDGHDTEYHKQGIEMVKETLQGGDKVRPILVLREGNRFTLLDGFKRAMAHKELGYTLIEAWVTDEIDERGLEENLLEMRACKGGQSLMPWIEGETEILYWRGGDGLRIERADGGYHIHWGYCGKYKLALGEDDFQILANAIGKI